MARQARYRRFGIAAHDHQCRGTNSRCQKHRAVSLPTTAPAPAISAASPEGLSSPIAHTARRCLQHHVVASPSAAVPTITTVRPASSPTRKFGIASAGHRLRGFDRNSRASTLAFSHPAGTGAAFASRCSASIAASPPAIAMAAFAIGIIHAGKIRIGIAASSRCQPMTAGRHQKPVIARSPTAALKIYHHVPVGAKNTGGRSGKGATPKHAVMMTPSSRYGRAIPLKGMPKRDMCLRRPARSPQGVKALDQVAKRTMLDH